MIKRHFLFSLFLFVLLFAEMTNKALGDVSTRFKQAETYIKNKQYDQAEQIYRQILTNFPDVNDTLEAQKQLVYLYIDTDKQAEANAAFEELTSSFSGHKGIAKAVHNIGYRYQKAGKYEKANQLYQYVKTQWPGDEYAMWAQMDIAKLNVKLGKAEEAQAAIDKLITQFSSYKDIAKAVHNVAYHCQTLGKNETANQLYQYIVTNWPGHEYAMRAQMDIAKLYIKLGKTEAGEAAIDKLLSEFAEQKDIAKAAHNVARHCQGHKKYEKAKDIYRHIVDNWRQTEYALRSQMDLAKLSVELDETEEAEDSIDKLIRAFSSHKDIAKGVHNVAYHCQRFEKYEDANELYQHILSSWPQDEYAMWAQMDVVKLNVQLGETEAAQVAIDKLLTQFSGRKEIAKAVHNVAYHCQRFGNNETAEQLYKHVLTHWPDNEYAMWAKMDIAKLNIRLGRSEAGQAAIDELVTDFYDEPNLPLALWRAAEGYYEEAFHFQKEGLKAQARENFTKVISLGEGIRQQQPGSDDTAEAWYFSGVCYGHLGQYEKAIECYENVVDSQPDCEYAWRGLLRISKMYKFLMKEDVVSDSEGWAAVKVVYEQIVQEYPECPAAGEARRWLERYGKFYEGGQK